MRRPRAAAVALALIVLVVAAVLFAGGLLLYRPLPTLDGDYRLLGLDERGEVVRDAYGVPQVYARTTHDLFFLQGYVTAQDRLFQLDLYRRTGRGRLAEVLGEAALDTDKFTRTIGLARAAEADAQLLSSDARAALEAYAAGINKYLEQRGDTLPIEFVILGYKPGPWGVSDSLVVLKLQSYDLATNASAELARANVAARAGPDAIGVLFPDAGVGPPTGFGDGSWDAVRNAFAAPVSIAGADGLGRLEGGSGGIGSNCVALAGARTASGKPLLEGDPHLAVRNPSIWYEVGLHGPGYDVAGFAIPGLPGIGIGHNARIAWSFTIAYTDVQDYFVERPDPVDPRRFVFRDGAEPATFLRQEIAVKGRRDPVAFDVAVTRHGPLMTPVVKNQTAPLALRWTALDPGRTMDGLLGMARASDWASFRAAAADISGATLSACYADVDGHIGYQLVGALPRRTKGDGRLPVPGWTGDYEWDGALPASANPSRLDPPEGYVVNANDRPVTDPGAVGFIGEWDPGFRAAQILGTVRDVRGADAETLRAIQTDYTSLPVRRFRDVILALRPRSPLAATAQKLVRDWDGSLGVDSAAAAIYESWLVHMVDRTFRDKLGDTVYASYAEYVASARATYVLYALLPRADDPWFAELGDPSGRGRDELAARALDDAVGELRDRLGPDPARWRWGALHKVLFDHPLSPGLGPLRALFDIGPFERAGDANSVNKGDYAIVRPYGVRVIASERMIVDLGDLDASWSVLPTGESGQPRSKHWDDQTPLWLAGRLHPMGFHRERLTVVEGVLVLRPR